MPTIATGTPVSPETLNYVSPVELPGPFYREILDLLGEECIEIAAAFVSGNADDLADEVGDLVHVRDIAVAAGIISNDGPPASTEDFLELALLVSIRASKCRRFGLSEVQPGSGLTNAARLSGALASLLEAVLPTCDPNRVELASQVKRSKLRKFLQFAPDGTRRVPEPKLR